MRPIWNKLLRLWVSTALLIFAGAAVQAGGVHFIPLTTIPMARSPIVIDGRLTDWPDSHPVSFVPVDPGLVSSSSPIVARLRQHPDSATLQLVYDKNALYVGIVWRGLRKAANGGLVVLNIATDRIVHISLPIDAIGTVGTITERVGDSSTSRNIIVRGAAGAVAVNADGSKTQEAKLPWSVLTSGGGLAATISMAADFEWPGLSTQVIRALPAQIRHDNTHLTFCFLTSADKLFTRDQMLGSPSDWGDLKFGKGANAGETKYSAMATGALAMFVPRAEGPVSYNGQLGGWEGATYQTATFGPGFLGSRYSAKIAAQYDDNYLYLRTQVNSVGGPFNTKNEATQAGYAGGDCLQIRLNDGEHTVNLCAWYDSLNKKAALTADGNDLKNPFLLSDGAKETFKADSDGGGYTQVIAIPWSALPSGAAPKLGDGWKATFQFWWAGLNPEFTAVVEPVFSEGGRIAYTYRLPSESDVTVAVFDGRGRLIRTLAKDSVRRAGANTEYWDGLDQYGKPVLAGKYVVKGIFHPPIEVQPVISIGNPGTPPWPVADGTGDWLSDESAPQAVVTDGSNVYLAAPGSEKGNAIIAVGPNGRRIWGYSVDAYPRCVSMTLVGNYLYALFSGPLTVHPSEETGGQSVVGRAFIVCLDKTTGAPAEFSTQKAQFQVLTWPYVDKVAGLWDLRVHKTITPSNYEGQTRYFANDVGEPTEAVGIAGVGNRLYVSMLTQNKVVVLDSATAKQVDSFSLAAPVGLFPLSDGNLLAISDGKVVRVDLNTKTSTTVINHDLLAPHDLTVDKAGNIYVSDWAASFQVKVFSASGVFIRAVGTPGGRPWIGKWDKNGMLLPRGIAVTDEGKLWVTEDDSTPNRISVWKASTGALIRDYIGPSPYGGASIFWADPTDISTIVAGGALYHIDYAKKTWTPVATPFRRLSELSPFTPNGMYGGTPGGRTIVHDGKQYFFVTLGEYEFVVLRKDGDLLTPICAIGSRGRYITSDGTQRDIWDSDIGTHSIAGWYPDFFKGHAGDNFVWTDTNGDGLVEPDEMQWAHTQGRGDIYDPAMSPEIECGWGFSAGPDGSVYVAGQTKGSWTVSRLDLTGWTISGAPIYDLGSIHHIMAGPTPGGVQGMFVDDSNHLFVTHGYEWNPGKHDAVDCYDRDGKLLWGMNAPDAQQQSDDFLADNVIADYAEPGNQHVLASWLWHANFKPYLLTPDGLYISSVLDDTRIGPTATWDESYKQYFQGPDGSAYIMNGVNDAYHIDKITGLDKIRRFSGTITVSAADLAAAAKSAVVAPAAPPAPQPLIHVAWTSGAPTIDGDLSHWNMQDAVTLKGSKGRSARIALSRDDKNLYLVYDVTGAKLVNKGGNWQTLFISGDCDDLMLHIGQYKPHFDADAGDERLLLSIFQGHPIAVLYRPVVPGSTSSNRLMATNIDQIIKLPSVHIAYKRSNDGYVLEASAPLADLGIDPHEQDVLKGDVGVIYADDTGTDRALRLYYYNKDTGMTADLSTEALLQPGNWGDVEFPLGPNLIKNGDFEEPLVSSPNLGWMVGDQRGGTVTVTGGLVLTGAHSLLLQETKPVVFTSESYQLPDYGQFINSANGGLGGTYVSVRQRVPVVGGHNYRLRYHYYTDGFRGGEEKNTVATRGYDSLMLWTYFNAGGTIWSMNFQDSNNVWGSAVDPRFNGNGVPVDYKAPEDATYVDLQFNLSGNSAANMPKAYIDDVEFVEEP